MQKLIAKWLKYWDEKVYLTIKNINKRYVKNRIEPNLFIYFIFFYYEEKKRIKSLFNNKKNINIRYVRKYKLSLIYLFISFFLLWRTKMNKTFI